eukprot:CAMPEP_0172472768 /NCGR_PEP_ID=MMETSP1065-20121228/68514_1 /TAXON_ID=265537 /ORGANISM="Amphiprora paludosa, Strain CCMP125" /LENGTH=817 /DNA_ID=CAMNT_0013230931 /DNA_START=44 /DNA_END=2497 /DNA_ORIENTATION=+
MTKAAARQQENGRAIKGQEQNPASQEQQIPAHEMETPIISNRELVPKINPPPFELPKSHLEEMEKDSTPSTAPGTVASTGGATAETGARFSSAHGPPIVLDKWPESSSDDGKHSQIPQTISVQKTESTTIRGISNYGQTCFLNSVVQSLASLSAFDVYLDTQIRANHRVRRSLLQSSGFDDLAEASSLPMTEQLWEGLRYVNGKEDSGTRFDPRALLKVVSEKNQQFKNIYQQQDAQELLTALLDVLVLEQDSKQALAQQPVRESWSWRPSPPENPRPAALSLSSAVPATVWALSSSFLQLRLPVLPVDETNFNEDEWNNDGCYEVGGDFEDDMSVTVASATREGARQRQSLQKQTVPSSSSTISTNHKNKDPTDDEKNSVATNNIVKNGPNDVTAATSASSTSSTLFPAVGEEKKQEEFELSIPRVNSEANMSDMSSSVALPPSQAASQNMSTTASVSTSRTKASHLSMKQSRSYQPMRWAMPLSGWMGSTLQCRKCQYVRPIRNVPFFDLSIVPTGTGNPHFMNKQNTMGQPCTVEECLAEFTKVERVESVECPSCTKQAHVCKTQEEVDFWQFALKDAASIQKKKSQCDKDSTELESIKEELDCHLATLHRLQQIDCDDDDCAEEFAKLLSVDVGGTHPENRTLLRSDANKCLFLTRLPPVFCLHVQRRYYDQQTGRLSKTNQPVLFNEYLNVAPYCAYTSFRDQATFQRSNIPVNLSSAPSWAAGKSTMNEKEPQQTDSVLRAQHQILYRLSAVLEHRGGANSGHYVCYRRSKNGGWCFVSDNEVRRVSWYTVQQCQAYMIFYENSNILEHTA